jgi:Nucleotide-diphospho-sugar transferase
MSDLPAPAAEAVLTAARALQQEGPVPIVFVTGSFAPLLDNWVAHARRAGVARTLVIALDEMIAAQTAREGCLVVPIMIQGELSNLWLLRLQVFSLLATNGIDFVHSDVDAVWLRDPRPTCFADPNLDLIFSQGTTHPDQAYRAWDLVLCCGFFAVRSGPSVAQFFEVVRGRAEVELDDQVAVNLLLLEAGVDWSIVENDKYYDSFMGAKFVCSRTITAARCVPFDLVVGLLPFHLVPRLAGLRADALVRHPWAPQGAAAKVQVLRDCGCWSSEPPPSVRQGPHWCLGMYGSASTWVFNTVMKIVGMHTAKPVLGRFVTRAEELGFLHDASTFPVVKSHDVDDAADRVLSEQSEAIWISVRDPRDCVASLMRYMSLDFSSALSYTHRSARFCQAHVNHPNTHLLRYEDEFMDNPATLDCIAGTLGFTLPSADRKRIFSETRRPAVERLIEELDTLPTAHRHASGDVLDTVTQWHRHHANRTGEIGRWRHELTGPECAVIENILWDWMAAFGYLDR